MSTAQHQNRNIKVDGHKNVDDSAANMDNLLRLVITRISEFIEAERTTLFLYDEDTGELWSKVAEGTEKHDIKEIRVKLGDGIAGMVMKSGETINITDAYNDSRFCRATDELTGFITRTVFCKPLTDIHGNRIGVIQVLNKENGEFSETDERLLDALCSQAVIAIENAPLYQDVKQLSEAEHRLNEELKEKQSKLQEAFLRTENSNNELASGIKRMRIVRFVGIGLTVILLLGLGYYSYTSGVSVDSITEFTLESEEIADSQYQNMYTVTPMPITASISLAGSLAPLELISIPSPFEGKVKEIHFQYGEDVKKGQLLLKLDITQLEIKLRKSETALIKARNELHKLRTWDQRNEVAGAKRTLLKAKMSLDTQERNLLETEKLFEIGIVPASELESSKQQVKNLKMDYQAAQEGLTAISSQANQENIKIAEFEVKNAELEAAGLREKMTSASIYAPLSGIIILPGSGIAGSGKGDTQKTVGQGTQVTQGDILISIGNMEGLKVKAKVNEVDIRKIKSNQDVRVTGDAFLEVILNGKITYISSQAILSGRSPIFEIDVTIKNLTSRQREILRLGMTVNLEVEYYRNDNAIMVPLPAVLLEGGEAYVLTRKASAPDVQKIKVITGITNLDSVEILEGIEVGDEVVLQSPDQFIKFLLLTHI